MIIVNVYLCKILLQAKNLFSKLPSLVDINIRSGTQLTICGDVHGQYYDLLNIFKLAGSPSKDHAFLFNGDFVDRGSFSVECMLLLLAYKCLFPEHFHLSRGNHETKDMNSMYGFEGETKAKYGINHVELNAYEISRYSDTMYRMFTEVFEALPIGYVIEKKILVVHGGLPKNPKVTLEEIAKIDRFVQPGNEGMFLLNRHDEWCLGLMCELLWADPHPNNGITPSKRGVAHQFGPDITSEFLRNNNLGICERLMYVHEVLDMVIRSHEVKEGGYVIEHDGKCVTIFSAPNYWYTTRSAILTYLVIMLEIRVRSFKLLQTCSSRMRLLQQW